MTRRRILYVATFVAVFLWNLRRKAAYVGMVAASGALIAVGFVYAIPA